LIRFEQNQNLASPKIFDLLRICRRWFPNGEVHSSLPFLRRRFFLHCLYLPTLRLKRDIVSLS